MEQKNLFRNQCYQPDNVSATLLVEKIIYTTNNKKLDQDNINIYNGPKLELNASFSIIIYNGPILELNISFSIMLQYEGLLPNTTTCN